MSDNQRTVLCVDDEKNVLNSLKRLLRKEDFTLLTANSGEEGLGILAENDVHLVISDQRMPKMSGTDFLRQVKTEYPHILRIILTGYTDVDSITQSINEGHIFKFFLKPWNDHNLKLEIRQALNQYDLIEANKALHERIVAQNDELKQINENLESMVLERTQTLEIQNRSLQISHAILEDLPLPIIGISSDGMIVLINSSARKLFGSDISIEIGDSIEDYFPEEVGKKIDQCIQSAQVAPLEPFDCGNLRLTTEIIPLSGRFRTRGVIMGLQRAA